VSPLEKSLIHGIDLRDSRLEHGQRSFDHKTRRAAGRFAFTQRRTDEYIRSPWR